MESLHKTWIETLDMLADMAKWDGVTPALNCYRMLFQYVGKEKT